MILEIAFWTRKKERIKERYREERSGGKPLREEPKGRKREEPYGIHNHLNIMHLYTDLFLH
jgi:hypothetical protein